MKIKTINKGNSSSYTTLSHSTMVTSPKKKSKKRANESKPNMHKKKYSYEDLVELMKPSKEELEYRKKKSEDINAVKKLSKLFKCTKCNKSFKSIVNNHEKVSVHPCLGVLLCQNCCDYYLNGEFSVDSEGDEIYCRWCGEGGTILGCSNCVCGFCTACIKKHWSREYFKKVQRNKNWLCFFCNSEPLWKHRFICSLAVEASKYEDPQNHSPALKDIEKKEENMNAFYNKSKLVKEDKKTTSRKRSYSSSSDVSLNDTPETPSKKLKQSNNSLESTCSGNEDDSFEVKKTDALTELGKVLKLSENHMNFGLAWITKTFKKFNSPEYVTTCRGLVSECQKIKQFLSLLSTYLIQFCNSVDSVEKSLQKDFEQKKSPDIPEKDPSPFTAILQFLAFVNNQVKVFVEKGITLSDILEMEVYDNGDIVGIKRKTNSSNSVENISEKSGKSDNKDVGNKEIIHRNVDYEGKKKTETNLERISQNTGMNPTDGFCENYPHNNRNLSSEESNGIKTPDAKADIQEILAILENA